MEMTVIDARRLTLHLLSLRDLDATLCPSEVAKALAGDKLDWRGAMPVVHEAIDGLIEDGRVCLSWKGKTLKRRDGPYRIGHGPTR